MSVAIQTGKNVAKAIENSLAAFPMPSQTMMSGTMATGGSGRSA
jgi:hypothetical protein